MGAARRGRPIREGRGERAKVAGNSTIRGRHGETVGDCGVAGQGEDAGAFSRRRLPYRGQLRPRERPAGEGVGGAGRNPPEVVGPHGGGHRRRFHPVLRRAGGQEEAGGGAQGGGEAGVRAPARDRPGPRRRVDQLAPARDPQAEDPGPPDRVPRDHRGSDQGGGGGRARPGREPREGAGEPPHPGPALRLHAVAGAVEEGGHRAERRPRAERGRPPDRRARGSAAGVPVEPLLGSRSPAGGRRAPVHGHPGARQRRAARDGEGLRLEHRRPRQRQCPPARRGGGARAGRRAGAAPAVGRDVGRGQARR